MPSNNCQSGGSTGKVESTFCHLKSLVRLHQDEKYRISFGYKLECYYISPSIVGKNREENIVKIGVEFIFWIEKEGQTSLSLGRTGIIYSCSMCLVYIYML